MVQRLRVLQASNRPKVSWTELQSSGIPINASSFKTRWSNPQDKANLEQYVRRFWGTEDADGNDTGGIELKVGQPIAGREKKNSSWIDKTAKSAAKKELG